MIFILVPKNVGVQLNFRKMLHLPRKWVRVSNTLRRLAIDTSRRRDKVDKLLNIIVTLRVKQVGRTIENKIEIQKSRDFQITKTRGLNAGKSPSDARRREDEKECRSHREQKVDTMAREDPVRAANLQLRKAWAYTRAVRSGLFGVSVLFVCV